MAKPEGGQGGDFLSSSEMFLCLLKHEIYSELFGCPVVIINGAQGTHPNLVLQLAKWKGFCMDLVIFQLICLMSSVVIIFVIQKPRSRYWLKETEHLQRLLLKLLILMLMEGEYVAHFYTFSGIFKACQNAQFSSIKYFSIFLLFLKNTWKG